MKVMLKRPEVLMAAAVYVNPTAVLRLLMDIDHLWEREGFGSDEAESEALKGRLERAIQELSGEEEEDAE